MAGSVRMRHVAGAMEIFEHLGAALGLASLAGINLYLTAFVAGLAIRFNWIELVSAHEGLAVLGNEWVLGVVGVVMVARQRRLCATIISIPRCGHRSLRTTRAERLSRW